VPRNPSVVATEKVCESAPLEKVCPTLDYFFEIRDAERPLTLDVLDHLRSVAAYVVRLCSSAVSLLINWDAQLKQWRIQMVLAPVASYDASTKCHLSERLS
jgi:hypothetical protein